MGFYFRIPWLQDWFKAAGAIKFDYDCFGNAIAQAEIQLTTVRGIQ
jgi:hypothetical protein